MKTHSPNSSEPIREVFESNFVYEMKCLSKLLKRYNYVGMDTEFPGTLYSSNLTSYKAIKSNVDVLKLIQVGISLADKYGNKPEECSTWQFNLQFSLSSDKYSTDSINMLTNCGIDFKELETKGISNELFAEYLLSSGLIINEDVKWICFHGIYDFAYLLHTITNLPLPESDTGFFEDLKIYFPCFFDIRYLIRFNESLRGSLSKLSQDLNVKRYGSQHQAGSDSLLTLEVFIKLLHDEYLSEESVFNERNCLFGISPDDSSAFHQSSSNEDYMNVSKVKSNSNILSIQTNNTTPNYDYNNYYQPMNSVNNIPPISALNINNLSLNNQGMQYFIQENNYYPYNMGMQYPMMGPTNAANGNSNINNFSDMRKKSRKGNGNGNGED